MSRYLARRRELTYPPAAPDLPPQTLRDHDGPVPETPSANRRFVVSHDTAPQRRRWIEVLEYFGKSLFSVSAADWRGLSAYCRDQIEKLKKHKAETKAQRAERIAAQAALRKKFLAGGPDYASTVAYAISAPETILDQIPMVADDNCVKIVEIIYATTYVNHTGTGAGEKPVPKYDSIPIPKLVTHHGPADSPARVRCTGPLPRVQAGVRRTDGQIGPAVPERVTKTIQKAAGRTVRPAPRYGPFC